MRSDGWPVDPRCGGPPTSATSSSLRTPCRTRSCARSRRSARGCRLDNPAAWITTAARASRSTTSGEPGRRAGSSRTGVRRRDGCRRARRRPTFRVRLHGRRAARADPPGLPSRRRRGDAPRPGAALRVRGAARATSRRCFLVSEATMAARTDACEEAASTTREIRFAIDDELPVRARLPDALTTISLLYTAGHAAPAGEPPVDGRAPTGCDRAGAGPLRLAPADPEASGLLGLLLLTEARQGTRSRRGGRTRRLEHADRTLWDRGSIDEGVELATRRSPGRHRPLRAAGGHRRAARAGADLGVTDWPAVARLYDRLVEVWPSPSAQLSAARRPRLQRRRRPRGPALAGTRRARRRARFDGVLAAQAFAARAEMACAAATSSPAGPTTPRRWRASRTAGVAATSSAGRRSCG